MKKENENGYVEYSIEEDEIIIEKIKSYVQNKGTATEFIEELKNISWKLNKPLSLYAYPQDDTITTEQLQQFYNNRGFELDTDDVDGCLFVYNK